MMRTILVWSISLSTAAALLGRSRGREAAARSSVLALLKDHGHDVDVLLTDVVMPTVSRPDLVREIRQQWPATNVIYMSGYAGDELDRSELESDDATFLQKPVSRNGFQKALMRVSASSAGPAAR